MNKLHKILTVLIVSLAFVFMTGEEYGHSHTDGTNHHECPVCVLTSAVHMSAAMPTNNIVCSFNLTDEFIIPEYSEILQENYHSRYSPDRAPPSA